LGIVNLARQISTSLSRSAQFTMRKTRSNGVIGPMGPRTPAERAPAVTAESMTILRVRGHASVRCVAKEVRARKLSERSDPREFPRSIS
jgi:hypothetical protein